MNLVKAFSFLLILVALFGCASQIQQPDTAQTTAEKKNEEQQRKSQMPTITYRPGG